MSQIITNKKPTEITKQKVRTSVLVSAFLNYQGKPIGFDDFPVSREILNVDTHKIFMKGSRQISKSATISFWTFGRLMEPYRSLLYVAPSVSQVQVFSTAKISERITESPKFKKEYMDNKCKNDVFEKSYTTLSKIYFRAESQLERIRGISAGDIILDERQHIRSESVPVIKEVASMQADTYFFQAGTPLSMQNPMETEWKKCRQIIPLIVCPAGHHNVPSIEMIERRGLVCRTCKERVSVRPPNLKLYTAGKLDSDMIGFWIPQIIMPIHIEDPIKWLDLYNKFCEYPPHQFLNEVMGLSAGSGVMTITENDMIRCCRQPHSFDMMIYGPKQNIGLNRLYAGIDWAGGNTGKSFTVLTIGGINWRTRRFQIIFGQKYMEPDPNKVIIDLAQKINRFGVSHIVADWGGGFYANSRLEEILKKPVIRVMYTGDAKKLWYDKAEGYFKASKTRTMTDTIIQIKKGKFHFPRWEDWAQFSPHFEANYAEEDVDAYGNTKMQYVHADDSPDDMFQATNIMFQIARHSEDKDQLIFS